MSDDQTAPADAFADLAALQARADDIARRLSAIQRRCAAALAAPTVVPASLSATSILARVILTALFVLFG